MPCLVPCRRPATRTTQPSLTVAMCLRLPNQVRKASGLELESEPAWLHLHSDTAPSVGVTAACLAPGGDACRGPTIRYTVQGLPVTKWLPWSKRATTLAITHPMLDYLKVSQPHAEGGVGRVRGGRRGGGARAPHAPGAPWFGCAVRRPFARLPRPGRPQHTPTPPL